MSSGVFTLVLLAALMHASWNALVKSAGDPVASVLALNLCMGALALPVALALGPPGPHAAAFVIVSGATHAVYFWLLAHAYRLGDLSVIYPLARGGAPLILALGALAVADVKPAGLGLLGVAVVSLGIMALGFGAARRKDAPPPLAFGAAAGVCALIAVYTLLDGLGGRVEGRPVQFAAWLFPASAVALTGVVALERRRRVFAEVAGQLRYAIPGGFVAALGYGLVIWAMSRAPIPFVAAVRESSVVAAALIGVVLFREPGGPARIAIAAAVAVGVVLIRLAG